MSRPDRIENPIVAVAVVISGEMLGSARENLAHVHAWRGSVGLGGFGARESERPDSGHESDTDRAQDTSLEKDR
jgi:hypothetical protein